MINHQKFISLLSQSNPPDPLLYLEQVKSYAENLDDFIRDEFAQLDLSPGKMFCRILDSEKQKKLVHEHITGIKKNLAQHFDMIAARVVSDVLNQTEIEAAVKVYTFWVDVAVEAGSIYKNMELERAIVSGLNHMNISRIFGPPDKPGYKLLDINIQENLSQLLKEDRYNKKLIHQTEFFPPSALYFSALQFAEEFKNEDAAAEIVQLMAYFKCERVDRKELLQDITVSAKQENVHRIHSLEVLQDDEIWDLSSQLREKFLTSPLQEAISTPRSQITKAAELSSSHSNTKLFSNYQSIHCPTIPKVYSSQSADTSIRLTRRQRKKALFIRGVIDTIKCNLSTNARITDSEREKYTDDLREFFSSKEFSFLIKKENGFYRAKFAIETGLPEVDILGLYDQKMKQHSNAEKILEHIILHLCKKQKCLNDGHAEDVKPKKTKINKRKLKLSPKKMAKVEIEREKINRLKLKRRKSIAIDELPSSSRSSEQSLTPKEMVTLKTKQNSGSFIRPKIDFFESLSANNEKQKHLVRKVSAKKDFFMDMIERESPKKRKVKIAENAIHEHSVKEGIDSQSEPLKYKEHYQIKTSLFKNEPQEKEKSKMEANIPSASTEQSINTSAQGQGKKYFNVSLFGRKKSNEPEVNKVINPLYQNKKSNDDAGKAHDLSQCKL